MASLRAPRARARTGFHGERPRRARCRRLASALALPLALPGATLTHPFGDDVNVYKVGVATATDAGTGRHAGGKLFATVYAIFSGVFFLVVAGVVLAPVLHRVLHRFHLDEEADG